MATAITSVFPATGLASRQDRALEQRAHSFLLSLTRAVQRASIYPPGHPAVSQGLAPLLQALSALVNDGPVTVAVGRSRLLLSGGGRPPTEHDTPWLASRLFDRELSAITISETLDASDLGRFVAWLSAVDPGELPDIAGLGMARFDGRQVRFREAEQGRAATPEALVTWHVLTAPLREAFGVADQEVADDDPAALSDRIRDALHTSEGIGVATLADQLVQMHQQVKPLDAESREAIASRLAVLVDGLSPELRGTLLTTNGQDDPAKLALIEDLLAFVSPSALTAIASSVTIDAQELHGPFARFLRKLSCLVARHPVAADALERRIQAAGLPASLVRGDDDVEHGMGGPVADVAGDPDAQAFVPARYGARLEELSTEVIETSPGHQIAPTLDEGEVDEHLARIALLELRKNPTGGHATSYLQWLADMLPHQCDRGGVGVLCEVADIVLRLRATEAALTPEGRVLLARCERAFAEPSAVTLAVDAIGALPAGAADLSAAMLLAGGADALRQALRWIKTAAEGEASGRVAAVIASVEPDLFKRAVAPQLVENVPAAAAIVGALDHVDPARAIDVGVALTAHASPSIRRGATSWLVQVPLSQARLYRVLQRAFDDPEPAIATLALESCARRPLPAAADLLASFISRRASGALRPLQARAAHVMGDNGADGLTRLAAVLRQRRWSFGRDDRQLSVTMARVLGRAASPQANAAARSWRWSPAGLISVITPSADHRS